MAHAQAHKAISDMHAGTRRKKVPAHWWDIVESQQAIARFDQATPTDEHTWRLVPKVQVAVKPKAVAPPPPSPPIKVAPVPPPKPAPVAPPPKATVAKAPAVQPIPPKAPAAVTVARAPTQARKLDPRLPAIGAVQTFTHPKTGKVYTWQVISDTGRVLLHYHDEATKAGEAPLTEEFSSVSSAAAKINNGTSTNGYLFFGLGKKA